MKHPWYWTQNQHHFWSEQRTRGKLAYWKGHVLFWTVFMFIVNGFMPMYLGFPYSADKTLTQLVISLFIWSLAGIAYGQLSWHWNEKLFQKYNK